MMLCASFVIWCVTLVSSMAAAPVKSPAHWPCRKLPRKSPHSNSTLCAHSVKLLRAYRWRWLRTLALRGVLRIAPGFAEESATWCRLLQGGTGALVTIRMCCLTVPPATRCWIVRGTAPGCHACVYVQALVTKLEAATARHTTRIRHRLLVVRIY